MTDIVSQLTLFDLPPLKHCNTCNRDLPATREFFKRNPTRGKLENPCRDCANATRRAKRPHHPLGRHAPKPRKSLTTYRCHIHGEVEPVTYMCRRKNVGVDPDKKYQKRTCPICKSEWGKTSYKRHRERVLAQQEMRRLEHPEYIIEWRKANRERMRFLNKRWQAEHREAMHQIYRERHLREKDARLRDFTHQQWLELIEEYNHCCAYCGQYIDNLTRDHVIPLSKGGGHTKSNIVPACQSCNSRKHNKLLPP